MTKKPNILVQDTYEVLLTSVTMEQVGSSEADALQSAKEWLDDYTVRYTIKEIRFKHHGL